MRLAGSVVAVTGGARGIGRATARALAAVGAHVAVGDLDGDLAGEVAAGLPCRPALARTLDVTDRASLEAFVTAAIERLGPLDGFVNNAGIMPLGPFAAESDASWRETIAVNLEGVVLGMQVALGAMTPAGHGHIVNVASMGGRVALPGAAVYTATKFAVVGLTEAVRCELAGTGVQLSLVLPTLVNTDLGAGVPRGRGFEAVEPADVASGIVAALAGSAGRDVYVPGWMRALDVGTRILPPPVMRLVRRMLADDRVLTNLDTAARAPYLERIAAATTRRATSATRSEEPIAAGVIHRGGRDRSPRA